MCWLRAVCVFMVVCLCMFMHLYVLLDAHDIARGWLLVLIRCPFDFRGRYIIMHVYA
jgi:hypothetical protein